MANMKTLTVNGVTYTIDDPDAVSYGAPQVLTEEEKQQARENIGAASPEQVDAAVSDLTDTGFAPNATGLKAEYYAVKDKNQGFYIFSGGRFQEEDGTKVDIAQLWPSKAAEDTGTVVLRGIYPGKNEDDAVNKGQLDSAKNAAVKETIDKTCPAFSETDSIVTCEPVEGYPLAITAAEDATKIYHRRKNLIGFNDFSGETATNRTMSCVDGVHTAVYSGDVASSYLLTAEATRHLSGKTLAPGTYVFSVQQQSTTSSIYRECYATVKLEDGTTVNLPDGQAVTLEQFGTVTHFRCNGTYGFKSGSVITFTLQIEPGSKATAHEAYQGEEIVCDGGACAVTAYDGANAVFADVGEVTVTGRANPAAILEKLRRNGYV